MKFLIVLLALVGATMSFEIRSPKYAVAKANDRSVASIIVDVLEEIKAQMPCGFPNAGIPILAPYTLDHKDFIIATDNFEMKASFDNLRIDGLDDFDVIEFTSSALTSKLTYKLVWNHVYLNTLYDLSMHTSGNYKWDLLRNGVANFGLKNVEISGNIKYSLGVNGGALRLKEFYVYVTIGEINSDIENLSDSKVLNKLINDIIEEWIDIAINENTEYIAQVVNDFVVPLVNDKIGDLTLNDIINGIGGGSTGSTGEGQGEVVVREQCVAPETK